MKYTISNKDILSINHYRSREVQIGNIPLGSVHPIRIQSMTNTPTLDTEATVEQCIRIINAGADYVRITTPTTKEAENLIHIKHILRKKGYTNPLVADIHFNADVAETAARIVEKIRINPGNYVTRRSITGDITDKEFKEELEKIYTRLRKLIEICKQYGTAMRIGVNHGSLSPRIMNRYGDTPHGMVESAMEFVRICASENFHQLVISLKASNTKVMVQAYRLLIKTLLAEGYNYPIHLGVTEAGDGEDGRIRSAIGIGTLLADGIGDTIRVSLTEDPENEIPVAQELVKRFAPYRNQNHDLNYYNYVNPFDYSRRNTIAINNIGNKNLPIVISDNCQKNNLKNHSSLLPDYYYLTNKEQINNIEANSNYILNLHDWFLFAKELPNIFPLYTAAEFDFYGPKHHKLNFIILSNDEFTNNFNDSLSKHYDKVVLIVETFQTLGIYHQREFISKVIQNKIPTPIIINRNYAEENSETLSTKAAADTGIFFIDGVADGIWIRNTNALTSEQITSVAFGILQASRVRTSKTEYISCPSCGRTLFNLQNITTKIKEKTSHLKHLKIAIMGCIVNGPGEMADADYGYVGAGIDKVTIYKGKTIIKKNIPSDQAIDELIQIIKENGDWQDP